ncbi:hypothetical protein, partial [Mordavella massiliensis]|uniref:hypothetical protein n=1 Tax=Mordavella massiliensis TaxID=1871024 RepID=UPI00195799E9
QDIPEYEIVASLIFSFHYRKQNKPLQPLSELKKGLDINGGNRRIKMDSQKIRPIRETELSR